MLVRNQKESISSINVVTNDLLLEDRLVAFWNDNPTYTYYLLSSFETACAKSAPAAQRIRELLDQSPPKM
jgi:hypothetical protein